jgi:hypothetical protein
MAMETPVQIRKMLRARTGVSIGSPHREIRMEGGGEGSEALQLQKCLCLPHLMKHK